MTPATTTLKIFRGAKWDHEIHFLQTGTDTPVNLTGLAPFVMEIRRKQGSALLLSLTYTAVSLANGQIRFTATAAQTLSLPEPVSPQQPLFARYGIRDSQNNPYAEAIMEIHPFTPAPS